MSAYAAEPRLVVRGLDVRFDVRRSSGADTRGAEDPRAEAPRAESIGAEAHVVDGLDFELRAGEVLALLGESGSGKSVTARALLGLVDPPGRIVAGSVRFEGRELCGLDEAAWRRVRGREIALVFQDPPATLNPVLTLGEQLCEAPRAHLGLSTNAAAERARALLAELGLDGGEPWLARYPHQLSGGQRQRAALAQALLCEPKLVIADEPTTALDPTLVAVVVELLRRRTRELGTSVLWITHDLRVARMLAQRAIVLYAGRVVEEGPLGELARAPRHPYTQALFAARPGAEKRGRPLSTARGAAGDPTRWPSGCRFHPRCPFADARCAELSPELLPEPSAGLSPGLSPGPSPELGSERAPRRAAEAARESSNARSRSVACHHPLDERAEGAG
ncbi:MAG: ATP-binding cassette domain-containing protein [Planctomycetes bacterium]|nr:ATP-binding cassette domain-containing protein [Planctomycetota bacterium]